MKTCKGKNTHLTTPRIAFLDRILAVSKNVVWIWIIQLRYVVCFMNDTNRVIPILFCIYMCPTIEDEMHSKVE